MGKWGMLVVAVCGSAFAGVAELKPVSAKNGVVAYRCALPQSDHVAHVSVDTASREMTVETEDGMTTVGNASKTTFEGSTFYYLTNGGYPSAYKFTLETKEGGWARLRLTFAAYEFVCETR